MDSNSTCTRNGRLFNRSRASLQRAFHYYPPNVLMWLKNCWKRRDGWMTFTSFSEIFESYQGDGLVIWKSVCNGIPFTIENIPTSSGLEPRAARSTDQHLTTELSGLLKKKTRIRLNYPSVLLVHPSIQQFNFLLYFSMNYRDFSVKSKLIISLFQTVKLSL